MSVPALRFKSNVGQDFPEGEIKPLGEVASLFNGRAYKQTEWKAEGTPVIRLQNLTGSSNNYYYSDIKLPENQYCNRGDLLYMWSATFGPVWWQGDKAIYHYHIWKIETDAAKLSKQYLYYVLDNITAKMKITSNGSTMDHITKGGMEKHGIYLPHINEQIKIANFFIAVDEKISQLTQKCELLAQYKKGVMQQIFSQKLRFKNDDGQDFPKWERMFLGELCSITTGKLDANAMVENGPYRFYTCAKEYYQIDKYAFDTDALLVSGNGANVGYIHHYKGKFNAYQRTYVLDAFKQEIIYIKYYLDKFLHERIFKEAKEGNTPYIVMGTLTEMQIELPCIKEQTKIANFLIAIDDKLTLTQNQLAAAKQYKQGLLQQMFI